MTNPFRTLILEMVETYLNESDLKIGSYDHTVHHMNKYYTHTDKALKAERSGKNPNKHFKTAEKHLKIVHNSVPAIKSFYKSHLDIDPDRYRSGKDFADHEHHDGKKFK